MNEFKVKKGLIVQGSGSTLLDIQGSQGQLFSVTDSLSGSLFSVNDISGMPIMEVFSDDRVLLGTFNAEAIKVSGSTASVTGSLLGTASWATNVINNGVTSVSASGTVSGLVLGGGPITSTGTLTLSGTISGLTNSNLSGTAGITNANLANPSLMIGTTGIALGATGSSLTGLSSVSATTFVGALTGNASTATTATNANNIAITNDTTTNATYYPVFSAATSGNTAARVDSSTFTYNPSTNTLTVGTFSGALSGTATNATNVNITTQNTTPVTYNIVFTGGTSGNSSLNVDSTTLTYNPSTTTLTTGYVVGTGIVGDSYLTISSGVGMFNDGGNLALGDYNGEGYPTGIFGTNGKQALSIEQTTIYQYVPTSYYFFIGTGEVNGEIAHWGAGSVTAGNLYYFDSSGNWTAADADAESTSTGLLGIARGTGTASSVGMLLRGHARFTANSSYTGTTTIGAKLYASTTAGAFSQTAPTSTGQVVRIIGYVQSPTSDQIYFCPDNTWVTLV